MRYVNETVAEVNLPAVISTKIAYEMHQAWLTEDKYTRYTVYCTSERLASSSGQRYGDEDR